MDNDWKKKVNWNEHSIKKLLQDHPGYRITITMSPKVDNDVVFIRVTDMERGLTIVHVVEDLKLVRNDNSLLNGLEIGYNELFEPFDEKLKEDENND